MIFRKEKVKDFPPIIFLLIFDFWAGTVCITLKYRQKCDRGAKKPGSIFFGHCCQKAD